MNGSNEVLGGGGIHHLAIRSGDFDASVAFYRDLLGCKQVMAWGEGPKRAVMLETGNGSHMEIFANGTAGPKPEGVVIHFAFNVADVDATVARVRAAGVKITVEPKNLDIQTSPAPTPVRLAFCEGPDGEQVEFFAHRR